MTRTTGTLHFLRRRKRLPVFKLDKTAVQKLGRRIRPLRKPSNCLSFSAWRLAHAVKKADCARWPFATNLSLGAAGFLLEHIHVFDWISRELRLEAGMAKYYADITRSSISGRVAEGMSLLFLEDRGYSYLGRFDVVLQEFARNQGAGLAGRKRQRLPDFIFANGSQEIALVEAKGKFVSTERSPDIKGPLRDALNQVNSGSRCIAPKPRENYAVGTFIREAQDSSAEQSLIAFVDSEPDKLLSDERLPPVEIPSDAIRRANYAPWISLMGFDETAQRLRYREGIPQSRLVPIIKLRKHWYVIRVASILPWSGLSIRDPDSWKVLHDCSEWLREPYDHGICLEIIGLDLRIVKALGTVQGHRSESLMNIEPEDCSNLAADSDHIECDDPITSDNGEFHGSIFSDGSLLGELWIRHPYAQVIESIKVEL